MKAGKKYNFGVRHVGDPERTRTHGREGEGEKLGGESWVIRGFQLAAHPSIRRRETEGRSKSGCFAGVPEAMSEGTPKQGAGPFGAKPQS